MGAFREIGKGVNKYVGGAAQRGVDAISKMVSTKNENVGNYVGEIGKAVIDTSKMAIDTVTQVADGVVESAYGVYKKDNQHLNNGLNEMKDGAGRIIRGIGSGIKYTVKSSAITVKGLTTNNREQTIQGLKHLGKVVAVSTFAVGVVDILDGNDEVQAQELDTRNGDLNGLNHEVTGVPFQENTIEQADGSVVTGIFPMFESNFSTILTEEMYLASDDQHFRIANDTLYQAIQEDPGLAHELQLSHQDIAGLQFGETPDGYVWHHHESPGVLQLVDQEIHEKTGHTGGREIWGGGSESR